MTDKSEPIKRNFDYVYRQHARPLPPRPKDPGFSGVLMNIEVGEKYIFGWSMDYANDNEVVRVLCVDRPNNRLPVIVMSEDFGCVYFLRKNGQAQTANQPKLLQKL